MFQVRPALREKEAGLIKFNFLHLTSVFVYRALGINEKKICENCTTIIKRMSLNKLFNQLHFCIYTTPFYDVLINVSYNYSETRALKSV